MFDLLETGMDWDSLPSLLRRANYTSEAVREHLGLTVSVQEILSNTLRFSLRYRRRLSRSDEPGALLAQLFMLAGHVPEKSLAGLDPALFRLLWQLGFVEVVPEQPDLVRGTVAITDLDGCYFISDKLYEVGSPDVTVYEDPHQCMPPHASSIELLRALRKPAGAQSFLDVGCGTGCQSIIFGAGYERVSGFDVSSRCVQFAQRNARLNAATVHYMVSDWESFQDDPYEHVAFNSPNADSAFDFINFGLDKILAEPGYAQIWLAAEVTADDGNVHGLIQRRTQHMREFQIGIEANEQSPFRLPAQAVRTRQLPYGSLLVSHPSQRTSFFAGLAERRVVEIASLVLTVQRRL